MTFIENLEEELVQNANQEMAMPMQKYMKNNFSFLGIKTTERRAILKKNCANHKEEVKADFRTISRKLLNKKEREFHHCAVEIVIKEINNNYLKEDIGLIKEMITTNSWWDSVDFLSKYLLGNYLLQFPGQTNDVINDLTNSENMWLNRSAILFQLGYKENTDFELLQAICEMHKHSKEFFIQKAIGWALRDYSRFNPNGVTAYVNDANLKPLSRREALRNILK